MSKISAYTCNCCNGIFKYEDVLGISETQDMFNRLNSFPFENNPDKANIHVCTECCRTKILVPAGNHTDRGKNPEGYRVIYSELSYILRNSIITKVNKELSAKWQKSK